MKKFLITSQKIIFFETLIESNSPIGAIMKLEEDESLLEKSKILGGYDFKIIGIDEKENNIIKE